MLIEELLNKKGDFYHLVTDWLLLEESDTELIMVNKYTEERITVEEKNHSKYGIKMIPILASILERYEEKY